jgi:hypothetical protein
MTNGSSRAPEKKPAPRSLRNDPRFEVVFEPGLFERRASARRSSEDRSRARQGALTQLLSKLALVRERGGAVLGDAYALAAKSFLERWERLEDLSAERRLRQRPKRGPSARAGVGRPTTRPKELSPPAK